MAILRLVAEGVGPFDQLNIDFSDGKGKPHLGPHILAGVNGSGKSTVLRAIASALDSFLAKGGRSGWGDNGSAFNHEAFEHIVSGHDPSRVCLALSLPHGAATAKALTRVDRSDDHAWITSALQSVEIDVSAGRDEYSANLRRASWSPFEPVIHPVWNRIRSFGPIAVLDQTPHQLVCAAYRPTRELRALSNPDMNRSLRDPFEKALGFEGAAVNEVVQAWLLRLRSKKAIAAEENRSGGAFAQTLQQFESAVSLICEQPIKFDVDISRTMQPMLTLRGKALNFSQLPDGVTSSVAWIADFMMRQELADWDTRLEGKRPGILLLDEADVHLHPQWQRLLLPAVRQALPDVQIIVTSHSPFVISSCPGSRVHILDLDDEGCARLDRSVNSPAGEDIQTTITGIFGIESRFDVTTERELKEWLDLKRSGKDTRRLNQLTTLLGRRSEELRAIVGGPERIPAGAIQSLIAATTKNERSPTRRRAK